MTTPATTLTTTTIAGTTTRRYVAFCRATLRHTHPATTTARSETQTQFSQYTEICIYEPGLGLVELSH